MASSFVHLHCHSEFSLLDGASRPADLAARAAELGMPALALTDHGSMYGAVAFSEACQKNGVKPIIGCEAYVAVNSRHDRTPGANAAGHHLLLLARNEQGYRNLIKLVSAGWLEGFYYKPRIDKELLAQHSQGLIACSACLAGEIPSLLAEKNMAGAEASAAFYRDLFGEDFYLELHDHSLAEERAVLPGLLDLSRRTGIPVVASNDTHYTRLEDATAHDVLLCIQTGKTLKDPDRMRFGTREFYFKTASEMADLFGEIPQALENTLAIAEKCEFKLALGGVNLPEYQVPEGMSQDEYLRRLCYEGVSGRYDPVTDEVRRRMDYELSVISQMGFSAYFLIVWDFIRYAREQGIAVGPGRGSAGGSLVAYVLGITSIDPLRYGLLFERMLNPDRVDMPDIDTDFCQERRDEVIRYVTGKYGRDRVAQIVTFGTMKARAAVRDVGRAMDIPYSEVDKVAKMIPAGPKVTLKDALQGSPELRDYYDNNPLGRELIDNAVALEGLSRHSSTHAAGVVISGSPLSDHVPLQRIGDSETTTQYSMEALQQMGLLKMDFLGLRTLTVIQNALKLIAAGAGQAPNLENLSFDDPETFAMISRGECIGLFQLESAGMRSLCREVRPDCLEDIVAINALFRPGPLGSGTATFAARKRGEMKTEYLHPALEPILSDTHGVILYQEQVMRIANELAGFSLGQADILRKAMSKKKGQEMDKQREAFLKGCLEHSIDRKAAGEIFDQIAYFAAYGFNKSHSVAYAVIAYQTAWLKRHYPAQFMAALMSSEMGNEGKVALYIEESRRLGLDVLPPDVNSSYWDFGVEGAGLRFGLGVVKNVGQSTGEAVIEARGEGPFVSLFDLCRRVDARAMNRQALEALIKGGACDSLNGHRAQLLAAMDVAMEYGQRCQKEALSGQTSIFDLLGGEGEPEAVHPDLPLVPELEHRTLLELEREALGLYVSGHPLGHLQESVAMVTSQDIKGLEACRDRDEAHIVGLVTSVKTIITRNGKQMAFVEMEDLGGKVEVVVFPELYDKCRGNLKQEAVLSVRGKVSRKAPVGRAAEKNGEGDAPDAEEAEEIKILGEEITPLDDLLERLAPELHFRLAQASTMSELGRVKELLAQFPGSVPVYLHIENGTPVTIDLGPSCRVAEDDRLTQALRELLPGCLARYERRNTNGT